MTFRDKYGWPVERVKGRPITNFIRLLFHTDLAWTFRYKTQMERMRRVQRMVERKIEESLFGAPR